MASQLFLEFAGVQLRLLLRHALRPLFLHALLFLHAFLLLCAARGLLLDLVRLVFLLLDGAVEGVAVDACVEVAFLAVVVSVGVLPAEVALAGGLEGGEAEGVFVVAGVEGLGPALEAVALALLAAVHAPQLDAPLLLAHHAGVVVVVGADHVGQHVPLLALAGHWTLLVQRQVLAILHAPSAQPHAAHPIVVVLVCLAAAAHAAELLLLGGDGPVGLEGVVVGAGDVDVDVDEFAAEAVALVAVGAVAGALAVLGAEGAGRGPAQGVHELQRLPAGALRVDVRDKLPRLGLVELFGQLLVAVLADAEVAEAVVVDAVVADGGADPADVADEVEGGDLLEVELVAEGAAVLGAGRHAAPHAVELAADAAVGAAQSPVPAAHADRVHHVVVRPQEELQLVPVETLVLQLHAFAVEVFRGDVGAGGVVVVEGLQGVDVGVALGEVVGADKLQLYLWDALDEEGL